MVHPQRTEKWINDNILKTYFLISELFCIKNAMYELSVVQPMFCCTRSMSVPFHSLSSHIKWRDEPIRVCGRSPVPQCAMKKCLDKNTVWIRVRWAAVTNKIKNFNKYTLFSIHLMINYSIPDLQVRFLSIQGPRLLSSWGPATL